MSKFLNSSVNRIVSKKLRCPSLLAKRFVSAKNQKMAIRLKKQRREKVAIWSPHVSCKHSFFGSVRDARNPASQTSQNLQ